MAAMIPLARRHLRIHAIARIAVSRPASRSFMVRSAAVADAMLLRRLAPRSSMVSPPGADLTHRPTYRGFSSSHVSAADAAAAEETHAFQAETRRLLDIVTNSLYTDKEVFVM